MRDSFLKFVVTYKKETPNKVVMEAFHSRFINARNVEWTKETENYEAIFSEDGFEKISKIDFQGNIIEVRTNIKPETLVTPVVDKLKKHGIIMNAIHIDNKLFGESFEFIIKDNWKVRHLFITDREGNVCSHSNFDDLV